MSAPDPCPHLIVVADTRRRTIPDHFPAVCVACDEILEAAPMRDYVPAGAVGALWLHNDAWAFASISRERAQQVATLALAQEWV